MNVEVIAGWMFGFGIVVSKDGLAIFLPVVMVMVDFNHYKRFGFNFQNQF